MPPSFIDKSQLLATPVEVPGLQVPLSSGQPGFSGLPGNDMMGGMERVLDKVNTLLSNGVRLTEQINQLRANTSKINATFASTQTAAAPPAAASPAPVAPPAQPPEGYVAGNAPLVPEKPPGPAPEIKEGDKIVPPKLNEAEARACMAELMQMIEKADEKTRNFTLGQVAFAYKMLPGQKGDIDNLAIKQLKAWLPRLVKP